MDKRLKQRLIGAAVLVALAVIIVPELIKEPIEQGQVAAPLDIPPRPQEPESPRMTISLPPDQPAPPTPVVEPVTEESAETVEEPRLVDRPAPSSPDEAPQVKTDPAARPADSSEPPEPPQPKGSAIASRQPAEPPQPTPPISEPEESSQAPRPTQAAEAQGAATTGSSTALPDIELIARSSGTGYTPSAPAASPVSPKESGWMVQAGSFAVEKNAHQLRDRLRNERFPVSVEQVEIEGRALHRVYVGPQASRGESETVRDRLRREIGIDGQVVHWDE